MKKKWFYGGVLLSSRAGYWNTCVVFDFEDKLFENKDFEIKNFFSKTSGKERQFIYELNLAGEKVNRFDLIEKFANS